MLYIFLCLATGLLIGILRPTTRLVTTTARATTLIGLLVLLLAMGAQLGSDERVLTNLGTLGAEALLLAAFSVAGSIVALQLAHRSIYRGRGARRTAGGEEVQQ